MQRGVVLHLKGRKLPLLFCSYDMSKVRGGHELFLMLKKRALLNGDIIFLLYSRHFLDQRTNKILLTQESRTGQLSLLLQRPPRQRRQGHLFAHR
jgi:hypothetical protein